MPPRKRKKTSSRKAPKRSKENPHLPGYLLIAWGLMTLPLNFGLVPGLEWAKAWPLILVLFGIIFIVKNVISEDL
jgi:hypothetical protein